MLTIREARRSRNWASTRRPSPTLTQRSPSFARLRTHIVRVQRPSAMRVIGRAPWRTTTKRNGSRRDVPRSPMYYLRLEVAPERIDTLLAELWEAGTLGVVEGDGFLEAFFQDRETAARFGAPLPAA